MIDRYTCGHPTVAIPVRTKREAGRILRWLEARGIIARYSVTDREVWAIITRHGPEWTYRALQSAAARGEKVS